VYIHIHVHIATVYETVYIHIHVHIATSLVVREALEPLTFL